jgi:hypothetical protein
MRAPFTGWRPFAVLTGLAGVIWALSAAHGYAWQMLWLPAAIAGASWPRGRTGGIGACLRRLQRDGRE